MNRARWQLILGIAVSGGFLYLALRGLKLDEFVLALKDARYIWLVPGILVYFLGVWVRTWRWHYMLRHIQNVPTRRLFPTVCIGYMGNNVYPARAGEVLRSYVLKRETGIRMSSSLATVVIERLFDGLTMLLFIVIAVPFVRSATDTLRGYQTLILTVTLLFLGALLVFLVLAARPNMTRTLYTAVVHRLLPPALQGRTLEALDRFMAGLDSLARGREVFLIFATSVLIWLFETAKYWFVMHAFPFDVSFFTLMLMNGIVNLATTIPAAPGYVGTFDLPGIAILTRAGVDRSVATAYTLVLHVALWLPITLLGAFFLWHSHLSVSRMRSELEAEVPGATEPLMAKVPESPK
jgi:hypothetical protein